MTSSAHLQPIAEHRAYLPLAALVAVFVASLFMLIGRWGLVLCGLLAMGAGYSTAQRNRDYAKEVGIWDDSIIKYPSNPRAFLNRGNALERMHEVLEALESYHIATMIDPEFVEAHLALATRFAKNPARQDEAIAEYAQVVRLKPDWWDARVSLGNLLLKANRAGEAVAQYEAAVRLRPDGAETHLNLGSALALLPGRREESYARFAEVLRLRPGNADAHFRWGNALIHDPSRWPEAETHFREALRLDGNLAESHYNLALLISKDSARADDAIAHYRQAIKLNPASVAAHYNLGLMLRRTPGGIAEAIRQFEEVLRLEPEMRQAKEMIEKLRQPRPADT